MREFTKPEKLLIDKLVNLKYSNNHKDIDIAKLLRSELNVLAIELQENCDYIKLYWIRDSEGNVRERDFRQMFKVVDFLDFIRLLEEKRYIYVSRLKNVNNDGNSILYYDRDNYGHEVDKQGRFNFYYKLNNGGIAYSYIDSSQLNTDVADLFNKYGNGLICPLQSLEALRNTDFKDEEQYRFDKEIECKERLHKETLGEANKKHKETLENVNKKHKETLEDVNKKHKETLEDANEKHKKQMTNARNSFYAALFAGLASTIVPFIIMKCTPVPKIDESQLTKIDSLIRSIKTEYPTKIEVALPDTLTIKDIETRKTINNIHIHNGKDENGVNGYDSIQHR